jgi:hypothetical protein
MCLYTIGVPVPGSRLPNTSSSLTKFIAVGLYFAKMIHAPADQQWIRSLTFQFISLALTTIEFSNYVMSQFTIIFIAN